MLKNNLICLVIHILVGIVSYKFLYPIWALLIIIAGGGQTLLIVGAIITFIISLNLYFILGKKLLKRYDTLKSIFSVSAVAIIGVGIWIFSYDFPYKTYTLNHSLDLRGLLYSMYNMYIVALIQQFESRNPLILIWFSFLPSVLMWCGLKRKIENKTFN